MKFNCGLTRAEKVANKREAAALRRRIWQYWFAWHPVRLAEHDCRWLEPVKRRWKYYEDTWEYEEDDRITYY